MTVLHIVPNIAVPGIALEYGPVSEPWGLRCFYVRAPCDRLVKRGCERTPLV
jgi:hypothetical protein